MSFAAREFAIRLHNPREEKRAREFNKRYIRPRGVGTRRPFNDSFCVSRGKVIVPFADANGIPPVVGSTDKHGERDQCRVHVSFRGDRALTKAEIKMKVNLLISAINCLNSLYLILLKFVSLQFFGSLFYLNLLEII